jgi:tellurite methyltransferase
MEMRSYTANMMKFIKPLEVGSKHYWDKRKHEPIIEKLLDLIDGKTVLDAGAGYTGRNAFFLASEGFDVTAIDIDGVCIAELKRRNRLAPKKIVILQSDLLKYNPSKKFDLIVCDMVLHFLSAEQVPVAIDKLKQWSKPGGYIVVTAYTAKNLPNKRPYLFKPNELKGYFEDWSIIKYTEEPTPWFHIEGEPKPRRNEAVYLIAQKPTH